MAEGSTAALLDAFLAGRNRHTLAAYRHDLRDFARFVGAETVPMVANLLAHDRDGARGLALAYRQSLIERGLSIATVNRRLAVLRNLVSLARTRGLVAWDLALPNLPHRASPTAPEAGTRAIAAVLTMLERRGTPIALRDRAIIRLLADVALQRAEVVSLDRESLDLNTGTLALPCTGDADHDVITLPRSAIEALGAWLSVRGQQPGPLFTNFDHGKKGDGRLTDRNVYATVRRHGEALGVHLRPHGLRSAAITAALTRADGDAAAVQGFSRHKTIAAVRTYTAQ